MSRRSVLATLRDLSRCRMRRDSKNRVLAPLDLGWLYYGVGGSLMMIALGMCCMGALLYREEILALLGVW